MFGIIKDNITNFLDIAVILTILAIGIFSILVDYRYFKRTKFHKDAAAALGIGILYILLPFVLLLITKL